MKEKLDNKNRSFNEICRKIACILSEFKHDETIYIVLVSNDIRGNITYNLSMLSLQNIHSLSRSNNDVINMNNNVNTLGDILTYIHILNEKEDSIRIDNINTEKAFRIIDLNNNLKQIADKLKEKNNKESKSFSKKLSDLGLNNPDITNKEQVEFSNKVENIKNIANNTSNSIVNINGHDDRELAKRLMSIHTNITKILEYSLRLDMKCHNYRFIEDEIIAFPLTKVSHNLLDKIVDDNKGIIYMGKDTEGNRILKSTGIAIISNYMYKGINEEIKERFEHAELLCPLVVQNYFNSAIYNKVKANLIVDIQNNKFNNFFVLMLVVYRGNILLQLWDRDYFIKQSKKGNVKLIRYVENSSNGMPYIDNIKGDLIKAVGLDSNSSTNNDELKYINGLISLLKVITKYSDYEYGQKDYNESLELVRDAYDRNIRLLNKQIYSKEENKIHINFTDILNNDELYSRCYKLLKALSTGLLHNN